MFSSDTLIEVLQANPSVGGKMIRKALLDLTHNKKAYSGVPSLLFQNCIVFKLKSQHEITHIQIKFDFDLLFQVQFHEPNHQDKHEIKSIQLEREGASAILKSESSPKQLMIWREYFQKTLKERGFHMLFKPLKKIGRGGFASVYLVSKNQDNKNYAIKAFSKQFLYSQDRGKQNLMNEIEMMRKCNHKNVIKLYGVFQTDNSIYLQVELMQGGQLSERMGKQNRTTSLQIKIIMKGLLQGLQLIHKRGIMHRDIKPENILFRKQNDCDCVIADFGLAESVSAQQSRFTRCGTLGYIAPEVLNIKDECAKYTCACDLFSVGIIFHQLLLKRSPFPGVQKKQILKQNKMCNFNFETVDYRQLPKLSLDLLQRLLELNPSKRITASDALKHGFFQNQFAFWESNRTNHLLKIEPKLLKENCTNSPSSEIQSPYLQARRKNRLPSIRKDSCSKLKVMENRTNNDQGVQSQSHARMGSLLVKRMERGGKSRFRGLSRDES